MSKTISPNSADYEQKILIAPSGFREYDARWLYEKDLNLKGVIALGRGMGTLLHRHGVRPHVVSGHDYRSYSKAIQHALIIGLMTSGCTVHDIGLCLSPMAYFAQFALNVPAVAMVTASHNDNGWTGVKMGMDRPLTFGPQEMLALKDIVLNGTYENRPGGALIDASHMVQAYMEDLTKRPKLRRRLKVIAACGNGTAGLFAPQILSAIGCEVVPLDCNLDYHFPRYNPNPEDITMLHAMSEAVHHHKADIAFGFDGDGDRCGIVDNEGHEIFADKVGLMLARDLSTQHQNAHFVVDVKSTGLFRIDPILKANGAQTTYWKTGHSYMKAHTTKLNALAGFEKSGHYFFRQPLGRGYDDGFISALAICDMLDRAGDQTMAELYRALPTSFSTPTMSPYCPDAVKYQLVDKITAYFQDQKKNNKKFAGQTICELITINGVRIELEDGSWGLVRASSNKPELVIVCESPVSEAQMRAIFTELDAQLRHYPEIGPYNQKI